MERRILINQKDLSLNDKSITNLYLYKMRKWLYLFPLFLALQSTAFGQCVDSINIDTYYKCGLGNGYQYDPVCACDGITYRNACAAEHWGGVNYGFWVNNTICGNFHFD